MLTHIADMPIAVLSLSHEPDTRPSPLLSPFSPDNHGEPDACYDIEIEAEDSQDKARAYQFMQAPQDVRDLAELDNKVCGCLPALPCALMLTPIMMN